MNPYGPPGSPEDLWALCEKQASDGASNFRLRTLHGLEHSESAFSEGIERQSRRPTAFDSTEFASARRALLRWFRAHARPLPWRRERSPYRVWVSEIMLQQTQVAAVVPYFNRFLRVFPSVRELACARRERVLELWSGLGYYRRARDLHRAAQIVMRRFGGVFPENYEAARSLPGVGDYTARAVLSIGSGQPYAVLDGNVARVVARWRLLPGHIQQSRFRRRVERVLDTWLSRRRPGNFNQALMELGQTVCLPRAPRCPACPLRRSCRAYARGRPESHPAPRPHRPTERRFLALAAIARAGKFALVRGLDENLLPELWNFPSAFGASPESARRRLDEKLRFLFPWVRIHAAPKSEFRHAITHRSITAQVYAPEPWRGRGQRSLVSRGPQRTTNDGRRTNRLAVRWLSPSDFGSAAVSSIARKVAASLESNARSRTLQLF